jgi:hypothetical protein
MVGVLLSALVPRVAAVVLFGFAVLASGCWSSTAQSVQPRDGRAGLQLTGTVAGRQVAVSDGAPQLDVGDCDPGSGGDADVCAIADDIDGQLLVLVIENPDVLRAPASLPVVDPGCGDACDDVTDGVVVDVQLGTAPRIRATGGQLDVRVLQPFVRYAGEVRLRLPSGSLSGSFDLVPIDED